MNPAVSAYAPVPLAWFLPAGRKTVETPIKIYLSRQVFMLAAQSGFAGSGKVGGAGVPGTVNRSLDSRLRGNDANEAYRLTQPLALPIVKAISPATPPRDDMGRRLARVPGAVNRSLDSRLRGNEAIGGSRFAQSLILSAGQGQSPEQRHVPARQRKAVPGVLAWRPLHPPAHPVATRMLDDTAFTDTHGATHGATRRQAQPPRPAASRLGEAASLGDFLYDQAIKRPEMPGLTLRMLPDIPASQPREVEWDRPVKADEITYRPAVMSPAPVLSREEVTQIADRVAQVLKQRERFERERQGRY